MQSEEGAGIGLHKSSASYYLKKFFKKRARLLRQAFRRVGMGVGGTRSTAGPSVGSLPAVAPTHVSPWDADKEFRVARPPGRVSLIQASWQRPLVHVASIPPAKFILKQEWMKCDVSALQRSEVFTRT